MEGHGRKTVSNGLYTGVWPRLHVYT
jgi:hypothetical protein